MSIDYSDLASIFDLAIETGRCGPNLEYDPRFLWIESEASGRRKASFAAADYHIDEPQADWREISAVAKVLLAQSKDLRTAIYLLRALLMTEGLVGLARGLYVINRLVAEYWDCLHPELESDDPTWRLNVLVGLSDSDGLLRELRNAEVVWTRQEGRITVGDFLTLQRTRVQASYVREADDLAQRAAAILVCNGDQPFQAALNDAAHWLDELRERLVRELTGQLEALREMIAIVRESLDWLESAPREWEAASADEASWSPPRSRPTEVAVPGMGPIPNDEMPRKLRGTHFSVYRPLAVRPEVWVSFLVYLHSGTGAAVDEDSARRLGRSRAQYDTDEDAARVAIAQGAEITVVPTIPGCQFNPRRQTLEWFEDLHVVEFRLRASPDVAGYTTQRRLRGHVGVYVGPLLVAEIPTSVWASDEVMSEQPVPTEAAGVQPFSRVFVSYSHSDDRIVSLLQKAYELVRIDYLRDVTLLRSGDRWDSRLLKEIDRADRFQLCWSAAASRSSYVEREWRHALAIQSAKTDSFICPFYWERPMPAPPAELAHLHFGHFELGAI